ncbi:hypothetical protein TNCV_3834111 [Trichonephila clavipes]|nr:hypothetical protein TNCV_3834111 [Trichonephila clavipes]
MGAEVHEQMFRSGGQSEARPQDLSPKESLVLIYRRTADLGSNPGEGMGVCKCRVPSRHGGTPNTCRAASPLVREKSAVEREERWASPDHPSVLLQNLG